MKTIPLSNGQQAIVDDSDYEELSKYKWNCYLGYARRGTTINGKSVTIRMHRHMMGVTDRNLYVDHINGDSLDNRRQNLRIVTSSQSAMNRNVASHSKSGYKGVYVCPRNRSKWIARLESRKVPQHIGTFDTKEEAALAYNKRAAEVYGEFFRPNVIS